MTEESAHELVRVLEDENDIVRVVDPLSRAIVYWPAVQRGELSCPCMECNSVWGRSERCPNCSSLEALRVNERTFKMELSNNHAFWVQSRPLSIDGRACVLETVNDVTGGLLIEGADRNAAIDLIDSLNHLVITDALTSLLNRRFLDEFIHHRMPEYGRLGKRVNVAMVDLDDMKTINDTYGHPAGDAVLKDIAGFLKLNYSSHDESHERYAVRYGGDEFLVIDVDGDFHEFRDDVLEKYANMRKTCYSGEASFPFSLSCGFSSSDEYGWSWDALLDAADHRMYSDKHAR